MEADNLQGVLGNGTLMPTSLYSVDGGDRDPIDRVQVPGQADEQGSGPLYDDVVKLGSWGIGMSFVFASLRDGLASPRSAG